MEPRRKKRFGQHHLRHEGLCRPLVEFLEPAGRTVLEIGPGGGVLTGALLSSGARVLAVEVDLEWAFALAAGGHDRLALAAADALDLRGDRLPPGSLVTGNLPFQVATPLIARVLGWRARVPRAAFMVQLEVARRLLAGPGEPEYGSLSVLTRAAAEPRALGVVGRRQFRPPPRVDAAFVGLELRPPPVPPEEVEPFQRLVRLAFGRRRKTLRNALSALWPRPRVDALLATAGLDRRVRAEALGLEAFVRLHRAAAAAGLVAAAAPPGSRRSPRGGAKG